MFYRIKNAWYKFKRRCQCFKRGYSWSDVWNMNSWFMRTVKPMLIHLRDHGIGIPLDLYLDGAENERAAWEDVLTEMINCLNLMDEDEAEKYLGIAENDYSVESYQKIYDFKNKSKDRFFELFSKYFYSLWD